MNGIIHVCSHPEDENPHFRITEEKIFADIFHYIEVWFITAAFILFIYCSGNLLLDQMFWCENLD